MFAGLKRVNLKEVLKDYGYGGSNGLGSSSPSIYVSKKSSLDNSAISSNPGCLNSKKSESDIVDVVLNFNESV